MKSIVVDKTKKNEKFVQKNRIESLYSLIRQLYPICRSITGNGVRETLNIIKSRIPLEIHEIPTGCRVFDWTIPMEWNINDAWIKNSKGEKIIDFHESNLHVLNYSTPVDEMISLDALKKHLHSIPEQPDLIPYRTSYYSEQWGFCLSHNQMNSMAEESYHVYIDSELKNGSLTYGELLIEGKTADEMIISCHICHPSLANDNLSGISLAVHLAEKLAKEQLHYSYRFLFIPGTIGSITWLAGNEDKVQHIKYGLVLSCVGDSGRVTYKRSRNGHSEIDRIVERVLVDSGEPYDIRAFSPYGYDERQFCSPGFDLPVGCFMRTPFGEFPQYHTSADNLDFISADALDNALTKVEGVLDIIESNRTYINLNPKCEPNLGKRGLYSLTGGDKYGQIDKMAILWVLNLSDGQHSLLDIAERANLSYQAVQQASEVLLEVKLLKPYSDKDREEIPG